MLERLRRAIAPSYRVVGFTLTAVGLATIAVALLWPAAAVVVGPGGVVLAVVVGSVHALRRHRASS